MKKFLIVLTSGEDTHISLVDASAKEEIGSNNDVAIEVSCRKNSKSFDSFVDLIKHVVGNEIELVGEFCGYAY